MSSSTKINLEENIQANVQRIMQTRVDTCRKALTHAPSHEAIHQARKELKKIRAIVRLVRPHLGEEAYREANHYFRDAARLISDARDVTASEETATKLQSVLSSRRDRQAIEQFKRHLQAKKAAITRYQVQRDHLLESVLEALVDAEQFYRSWAITEEGFEALSPGIRKIYKQCVKRQKKAYAEDTPEGFHQWRKSVKYLRYQIDALSTLWPGMLGALESELNLLTDYLGDDHDFYVLQGILQQHEAIRPETLRSLNRHIEQRRSILQHSAKVLSDKLFYPKSNHFVEPIAHCWRVEAENIEIPIIT